MIDVRYYQKFDLEAYKWITPETKPKSDIWCEIKVDRLHVILIIPAFFHDGSWIFRNNLTKCDVYLSACERVLYWRYLNPLFSGLAETVQNIERTTLNMENEEIEMKKENMTEWCDSCIHRTVCMYAESLYKINDRLRDVFYKERTEANVSDEVFWLPGTNCTRYVKESRIIQ